MEYLLYVFAKHDKQEKFVTFLSEEIFIMTNDSDIRYYYGPESVIFKFRSDEKLEDIGGYLNDVLGCSGIVFFLQPYEKEKLYYWVDSNVNKHLFGIDDKNDMTDKQRAEFQKFVFKGLDKEDTNDCGMEIEDFDEGFLNLKEFLNIEKEPVKIPSLDEILDNISEKGIKSLNETELQVLNNYSK